MKDRDDDLPVAPGDKVADGEVAAANEGAAEGAEAPEVGSVDELRAQVERYREEAEQNWQQFLHAAADLENYKKQAARQREDAVQRTRASMLIVILSVVDTLERALEHSDKGGEAVIEGIRMAHRRVLDLLANMGVRAMEVKSKPFDPRFHEAIDVARPDEHGVEPGIVVEEIQKGYLLNGEVLRPARVRVAK